MSKRSQVAQKQQPQGRVYVNYDDYNEQQTFYPKRQWLIFFVIKEQLFFLVIQMSLIAMACLTVAYLRDKYRH